MANPLISILLAFAGYSMLNIGQAGQKIGLSMRHRRRVAGWLLWTGATAATSLSVLLVLSAISIGSVALVGAMSGTGLAALAVFSHFVMGERLTWREVAAIAAIIAGAVAMGLTAPEETRIVRTAWLYSLLGAGVVIYVVGWLIARGKPAVGVVIGGLSGFLGAYSQLFQKFSSTRTTIADGIGLFLESLITNPVTLIWVGLSVASMLVIQFAYRHADAIRIIPAFTTNFIVIPAVGGVIVFGESLAVHQWAGIAVMLPASGVLSRRRRSDQ